MMPEGAMPMFYIHDLAAHEMFGPFTSQFKAHAYAKLKSIGAYRVMTDTAAERLCDPGSVRVVAHAYR